MESGEYIMDSSFEITKYTHDKNPNPHIHETYEILIPLNDGGKFFIKERGYQLRLGMVFILSPFEIHRCFCHGDQDYDRYVIHFSKDTLRKMSTKDTDLLALFDEAPLIQQLRGDIMGKTEEMLSSFLQKKSSAFGSDVEDNIKFQYFLLLLARLIKSREAEPLPIVESDHRINRVLQYIHTNYTDDITLDRLSKVFFISKSRLSQIFKDATGFSVGDYIITYRIKRAGILLQEGVHVQDVGRMVGFRSDTHFIRTFKKRTGCSPGKFARSTD